MKTQGLQRLKCLSCGGELHRLGDDDRYGCVECGEVFDLRGVSKMELNFDEFDRLLLYALKSGARGKNRPRHNPKSAFEPVLN